MKQMAVLLMGLFIVFLPSLGSADCTGLGRMNRWVVQDNGSIIFYYNNVVLATVELQDCTLSSSSRVDLLKDFVCQGDHISVDGETCTILSLTLGE